MFICIVTYISCVLNRKQYIYYTCCNLITFPISGIKAKVLYRKNDKYGATVNPKTYSKKLWKWRCYSILLISGTSLKVGISSCRCNNRNSLPNVEKKMLKEFHKIWKWLYSKTLRQRWIHLPKNFSSQNNKDAWTIIDV